ncbi:hypothetical protein [Aporhodopirellula aestuarii]|uniref:Uncharacterized protein n=1 Tax=Aporhodopirellula aestuarii TaxID=2950107 RepID=A0ABT0UBN7_9BACT|nr:hypothetical protein [Aporhodopirellula aestuarii]MCM2374427.1 hypothetical protein [Aporhodopirellula aestuarii]
MSIDATLNSKRLVHVLEKHVSNRAEPWHRVVGATAHRVREVGADRINEVSAQDRGLVRSIVLEEISSADKRPMFVSFSARDREDARKMLSLVSPKGLQIVAESLSTRKAAVITSYIPDGCQCWKDVARALVMRYRRAIIDPEATIRVKQRYEHKTRIVDESEIRFHTLEHFGVSSKGSGLAFFPMEEWDGALPCPEKKKNRAGRPLNQKPLRGGLT